MFAVSSQLYKRLSRPLVAAGLLAASTGGVYAQAITPASSDLKQNDAPVVTTVSTKQDVPAIVDKPAVNDVPATTTAHSDAAPAVPVPASDVKTISHDEAPPADLELGGQTILTLHASAGNLTPQERIDVIEGRLVRILGIPRITPDDVAVYTPLGKAPVIYAVGRKLITVDSTTAKQEKPLLPPNDITAVEDSVNVPLGVATVWAKRFQQILPLVDYRMPGDPEPIVPPNPILTVTDDQTQVGGQIGDVIWGKDLIMRLRGVQHDTTAAERADVVGDRMQLLLHRVGNDPETISVAPGEPEKIPIIAPLQDPAASLDQPASTSDKVKTISSTTADPVKSAVTMQILPTAAVKIGSTTLITVTTADAAAASQPSPDALAASWAKNLRQALSPSVPTPSIPEPAKPEQPAMPASTKSVPAADEAAAKIVSVTSPLSSKVTPDPNITTKVDFQAAPAVPPDSTEQVAPPIPVPATTVGLSADMRIRLHTPLPFKARRKLFI